MNRMRQYINMQMVKLDKNMTLKNECLHFSCKMRIGQRKRYKGKSFRAPENFLK